MRTTINLPDDLHRIASGIARDQGTSLSGAVALLLRRAVGSPGTAHLEPNARTGFIVVHLGRTITTEDVRALDDEE